MHVKDGNGHLLATYLSNIFVIGKGSKLSITEEKDKRLGFAITILVGGSTTSRKMVYYIAGIGTVKVVVSGWTAALSQQILMICVIGMTTVVMLETRVEATTPSAWMTRLLVICPSSNILLYVSLQESVTCDDRFSANTEFNLYSFKLTGKYGFEPVHHPSSTPGRFATLETPQSKKRRSPASKASQKERLLRFHQKLVLEKGLPSSRLQNQMDLTPSPKVPRHKKLPKSCPQAKMDVTPGPDESWHQKPSKCSKNLFTNYRGLEANPRPSSPPASSADCPPGATLMPSSSVSSAQSLGRSSVKTS